MNCFAKQTVALVTWPQYFQPNYAYGNYLDHSDKVMKDVKGVVKGVKAYIFIKNIMTRT